MKRRLQLLLLLLLALPIGMLAQGSSWGSATFIESGKSGSSSLDDKTTDVYYKINVPEEGTVKVVMTCTGDLRMNYVELCWYRAAGGDYSTRSNAGTGWYPDNGKVFGMTNAGKGVYYLHAQRRDGKGTLTLSYQFTACSYANDAENNDNPGSGSLLKSGETVQGRIGYRDATDYVDDNDWYKIEVPQDGRIDLHLVSAGAAVGEPEDGENQQRQHKGRDGGVIHIVDMLEEPHAVDGRCQDGGV